MPSCLQVRALSVVHKTRQKKVKKLPFLNNSSRTACAQKWHLEVPHVEIHASICTSLRTGINGKVAAKFQLRVNNSMAYSRPVPILANLVTHLLSV